MGMLGILTFVKRHLLLVPDYVPNLRDTGLRIRLPVAGVFGTLNPAMIVSGSTYLSPYGEHPFVHHADGRYAVSAGAVFFLHPRQHCALD